MHFLLITRKIVMQEMVIEKSIKTIIIKAKPCVYGRFAFLLNHTKTTKQDWLKVTEICITYLIVIIIIIFNNYTIIINILNY